MGSFVSILVAMLIALAGVVFYMRGAGSTGGADGAPKATIDRTRHEADRIERLQQDRLREMDQQTR
jgi:hypothetical protein